MAKLTKGRVSIPQNALELLTLANKVFTKHRSDAATSILNSMIDQNWNMSGPKIVECTALHNQAEALKAQMEQVYRQRDLLFPEIDSIVRDTRSFLKGVYSKNPKKLGEWGYEIDDTAPVSKKAAKI